MADSKNSDLETTHNHHGHPTLPSASSRGTHDEFFVKSLEGSSGGKASFLTAAEGGHKAAAERSTSPAPPAAAAAEPEVMEDESVREKLKRHRVEVSGRVCIPDIWGQEDLLKNWIDFSVFDSSLDKSSIMSAREGLVQEGRSNLGMEENSC